MPKAKTDLTTDDWPKAKSLILQYLDEGWSINIAYSKSGVNPCGMFKECFQNDLEFRQQILAYKQKTIGFHSVHDRLADKSPQVNEGPQMGDLD